MKFEAVTKPVWPGNGMYRKLYHIISLPTRSERMTLFFEWVSKRKGDEEE